LILIVARVKAGLKKRKVKVFLLFLFCSALAWFINNLSQSFVSDTRFSLEYIQIPDDFLLAATPKKTIEVRLRAIGFQFMGFEIQKQKVQIDLAKLSTKDSKYYILPKVYRKQIVNQLPKNMELIEMESDTLFIDLIKLVSKEVTVLPRSVIELATNYMLEDSILFSPETVILKGPINEVDTITLIRTSPINLTNLSADFSKSISLLLPDGLASSKVIPAAVTVSGRVFRFSEKVLSVPVAMINVPDSVKVRMFPDQVKVLCVGKITALKAIKIEDLKVVADYNQITPETENRLSLLLDSFPTNLNKATLLTKEIEFILRRQ